MPADLIYFQNLQTNLRKTIDTTFNNEEDQKAFAAWQAEQARCSAKEKQDVPDGERLLKIN